MGSPSKEGSRSPEGSAGSECPFTGLYSRHLLLPAVWHTNSSTASWCGASPGARRRTLGQGLSDECRLRSRIYIVSPRRRCSEPSMRLFGRVQQHIHEQEKERWAQAGDP